MEPAYEPHRLPADEVLAHLASAPEGLSEPEAALRLLHEGPNAIAEQPRARPWLRFARHLSHRFALLLWAGALFALLGEQFSPGQGMALIAAALVGVVLINGSFSFWQETRVERAMEAFRRMLSQRARVLRSGSELEIPAIEVVVGDVLVLREGDRVPADARLIEARALKVDNSPLTGECEPQLRSLNPARGSLLASRNLVFCGTLVTTGSGKAVVYAIGGGTELGRIAGVVRATSRVETPISRELHHFIRVISAIALSLGVLFFAVGWLIGNPFWTNLVFAIGIIVANVPEGLLPTVTLALAIAGRKMVKRNALLKTLESAETLGCTSVICTDKTGTLTENEMRVTDLLLEAQASREQALRVMVLCNNATLGRGGDPTEVALLLHADRLVPGGAQALRAALHRVYERPFDSATREMVTLHRTPSGLEALLKGAPEVVLEQCRTSLGDERTAELRRKADELARAGKRVLALAYKPVGDESDLDAVTEQNDYRLAALVAMHDPPRPEVQSAVERCRGAGIRILVISGDHPLTVEAIAREVGISAGQTRVLSGDDLARLGKAALRKLLASEDVLFARTSPLDKLRIVTALQEMGHVVAVTGDGVNDAPALKRADIGIAMGLSGTDVAREAADMVLMDDNFATIVAAVEEGRVIYGNIRRFIGYVLTSNVPEILPFVAFVLLGIPLPLPVLLVLAIDLGTDMAPAIGLAKETVETDVMREPPRSRSERLLSKRLLFSAYLLWGSIESAAGFAAYAWVLSAGGWRPGVELAASDPLYGRATAAFFVAVVTCQVANVMIWRTTRESVFKKGLLSNRAVVIGIAAELLLAFGIVQTGAGQALFNTSSLPLLAWLLPIPFAIFMLALAELSKLRKRSRARRRGNEIFYATAGARP